MMLNFGPKSSGRFVWLKVASSAIAGNYVHVTLAGTGFAFASENLLRTVLLTMARQFLYQ